MTLLKKVRYDAIINEAKGLFLENGIEGVTIADIASHLSIGEASLYRYFGKKQKIIIEAGIILWDEVYNELLKKPVHLTGYENIEAFYYFFLEVFEKHMPFYKFVNEFDLKAIQGMPLEELREYEETILKFKEVFDRYYDMGIKDGSIKGSIDQSIFYYSTSHSLLSLCKKLATQPQVLEYEQKIDKSSQIECLITVCLQYIKK